MNPLQPSPQETSKKAVQTLSAAPQTRCPQEWIVPTVLEGPWVRLEPLRLDHAADLATAAESLDTFALFSRGPAQTSEQGMADFIEYLLGPAQTVAFCVIDTATGRPLGITTYLDIRPAHRGVEIGWTWYGPSARGTRINPAAKLLLLEHAFDRLQAVRVCLKTDERNARSRAAILKLGATFEGVLRHNIIKADGFRRSTAMFSILESEWPHVRAGLHDRLR